MKMLKNLFGKMAREHGFIIGSGIGLNFCKRAVEELGGRIWIDSEENKGTTITFTLPIKGEFAE